jgi:transcriptional regulator with XRE-family HTH domain
MGDLGERLKREREARGVSLRAIAEKTRIGVRFLKAIEEEEFDQLPGGIFNKSFIQQYAQLLGLDEKQAVRDYLRATEKARETQHPQQPPPRSSSPSAPQIFLRLSVGVAAIGLVVLLVWLIVPGSGPRGDVQVAAVETPAAPAAGAASPVGDSEAASEAYSEQVSAAPVIGAEAADRSGDDATPGAEAAIARAATASPSPAELLTQSGRTAASNQHSEHGLDIHHS